MEIVCDATVLCNSFEEISLQYQERKQKAMIDSDHDRRHWESDVLANENVII